MFIAALFIIAKIWKQLKCPSTDKWIKKMSHTPTPTPTPTPTHTHIGMLLGHEKKENLPFATTWMDSEDIM